MASGNGAVAAGSLAGVAEKEGRGGGWRGDRGGRRGRRRGGRGREKTLEKREEKQVRSRPQTASQHIMSL